MDPIADMLTRIRNSAMAGHEKMVCPSSKVKKGIVDILEREGFIANWQELNTSGKRKGTVLKSIEVSLRYDEDHKSILRGLKRVSKPSRRLYVSAGEIPRVRNGLGIAILTTNKGLLTDKQARDENVGGEVLCYIW
jgi:small subunit ribosomal protein S8